VTYEPSEDSQWDAFRAAQWDLYDGDQPCTSLPTVLGLIGAGNEPEPVQRRILGDWMRSAAYVPAPDELKAKCEEFMKGGTASG
jgi:hypothetical protein